MVTDLQLISLEYLLFFILTTLFLSSPLLSTIILLNEDSPTNFGHVYAANSVWMLFGGSIIVTVFSILFLVKGWKAKTLSKISTVLPILLFCIIGIVCGISSYKHLNFFSNDVLVLRYGLIYSLVKDVQCDSPVMLIKLNNDPEKPIE
ncbi:hypothetical protein BDD26_0665 [Xenorhabdus cabanillasii]|uniref:Uncharacterized protein n=1 Tax=Xenorhabdus cabanillasii TaxID=351673 RepID=A0A3D9UHG2_9GAMM|nr:hypothetical protein [Xenorhabdus cabanillasii]REF26085.1 hypothetical protein BDD26_0665 [Xenorhabdus cabanillasii]